MLLSAALGARETAVHHELTVQLDPAAGQLAVRDLIRLPAGADSVRFLLHAGLQVESKVEALGAVAGPGGMELRAYRATPDAAGRVELRYAGGIHHERQRLGSGYAGGREATAGTIGPEGVFLAGSSYWYPVMPEHPYLTFEMQLEALPDDWLTVSQGRRLQAGWAEHQPQDDLYLIAAPFQRIARATPWGEAEAYLRTPDRALAERYLAATARYLALYSELIGPYPYAKFALAENFWETGYGMPSFTLLGPRVLRLPFILHSAYPHEILHNWWGNGVYTDYAAGNWAEGLTAYLADHLLAEAQGRAQAYRRDNLQKYADFVHDRADFPLRAFRARHGEASQAIGYGKALMVWHMLRRQIGDYAFVAGLRRFYQENRFRTVGFDALQKAFEAVTAEDLDGFFRQWLDRKGGPALAIAKAQSVAQGDGYRIRVTLRQIQAEPAFALKIPVAVWLQGRSEPVELEWSMQQRSQTFTALVAAPPQRLRIDPGYELFRRLDPSEIPASIGQLFAAESPLVILPAAGDPALGAAYQALAAAWQDRGALEVIQDTELEGLPAERAVWILGADNRFAGTVLQRLQSQGVAKTTERGLLIDGQPADPDAETWVLTAQQGQGVLGWISLHRPEARVGLARKLPHYGKYGYLAFTGVEPENRLKGQWPAAGEALSADFGPHRRTDFPLAPRPPLMRLAEDPALDEDTE